MARTIEIEDDIYQFLRSKLEFGETASVVLRRLLRLPPPGASESARSTVRRSSGVPVHDIPARRSTALLALLAEGGFQRRNPTDRYLRILALLHNEDPQAFRAVLEVAGRRRKYFGHTRGEIEASGKSTHPQPIPDSPYWAMTNADTGQKSEILRKVMAVLNYSADDRDAVEQAMAADWAG
jgi:negative modulator of initiation of replication